MEVTLVHPWSGWINAKFEDFRKGKRGGEASLTAFSRLFGAPHQVVLGWMREGATPPRKPEYIQRVIELYGEEAYPALGIPVPEAGVEKRTPNEVRALEMLREVPEEDQAEVLDLIEHYLFKHGFRRVG